MVEQAIFRRPYFHRFALHEHLVAVEIDAQALIHFDRFSTRALRRLHAAQHRAHPANQFARAKRLGDIIIRAQLQPTHAVIFIPARGQHDYRHIRCFAQQPQRLEAIHLWHHHIKNHQVRHHFTHLVQRILAVISLVHREAFQIKIHADEADHALLVIHYQNAAARARWFRVGHWNCGRIE